MWYLSNKFIYFYKWTPKSIIFDESSNSTHLTGIVGKDQVCWLLKWCFWIWFCQQGNVCHLEWSQGCHIAEPGLCNKIPIKWTFHVNWNIHLIAQLLHLNTKTYLYLGFQRWCYCAFQQSWKLKIPLQYTPSMRWIALSHYFDLVVLPGDVVMCPFILCFSALGAHRFKLQHIKISWTCILMHRQQILTSFVQWLLALSTPNPKFKNTLETHVDMC